MRAVIYQHETHEGLGRFEPALKAAGFTLVKRFRGTEYRDDVAAELLVILGGSVGVRDAEQHPFIREERAVLAERLISDKPNLAICFGAQLLASAAGAEVLEGKNGLELGVAPIRWTAEALKDPVIAGVSGKTLVAHWHRDTWKPVEGATLLASTDRYTQQVIRIGKSYAFQCHPELTGADWARWVEVHRASLLAEGKDVAAIAAQGSKLAGAEGELNGLVERLVHHFVKAVS